MLWKGAMPPPRHLPKYQHSLPPPNRWCQQTSKPIPQTVPQDVLRNTTEQLACLATYSPVYKELMAIRHHKESPIRPSCWIYSTRTPAHQINRHSHSRETPYQYQRSQRSRPRGPMKSARQLDKAKAKIQAICNWRQSLAGRNQSKLTCQHHPKVITKAIRTLLGSRHHIKHHIQNRIATSLEDPQCLPRIVANTISRNRSTQPKLDRTAT